MNLKVKLTKDYWDKCQIIGLILIPIIVFYGTFRINSKLNDMQREFKWQENDQIIVSNFQRDFPNQYLRPFAVLSLRSLQNHETEIEYRQQVTKNLLDEMVKRYNSNPSYRYNENDTDCGILYSNFVSIFKLAKLTHKQTSIKGYFTKLVK